MKILVSGCRDWRDADLIKQALITATEASTDTTHTLVHGACRTGADRLAAQIAKSLGFVVLAYPADWMNLGKAAGPVRNQKMIDENPDIDLVLLFPLPWSRGTVDMLARVKRAQLPYLIYAQK